MVVGPITNPVYHGPVEAPLGGKYVSPVLVRLLDKGNLRKRDFAEVVKSNNTLDKVLLSLRERGLVTVTERFSGRRTYTVSLTERGRSVAEQLKQAEEAALGEIIAHVPPETTRRLRAALDRTRVMHHVNVLDDTIRIGDIYRGKERIVDVQVRAVGKALVLYCDQCRTNECEHIDYAWAIPKARTAILERARRDGLVVK